VFNYLEHVLLEQSRRSDSRSKETETMKSKRVLVMGILLAGVILLQALPRMMAQEPEPDQAPGQDPPGRVARLNYSVGSVSMQPGGEGDWAQAVSNRPLTTGDNLWADKDSRAELHVGSTAIRMDSETSVTFLDLDDHMTQLKLSQGSIVLRVRHLDDGDTMEVDTPNLAFDIQTTGEYRIDVNGDGNETDTTVWHGRGEATGGGASFVVVAGQRARFSGTDELDHEIGQIPGSDDFDNFSFDRDKREDGSESANYISPEMTGYEDLDDYGHWHYVADYGPVWTPSGIAADWAPYRVGHWVFIEPWGWTWVEDEPWGFAPFHYGRWAYVQSSWCWVPGPVVVRPVYAPALVAFVGGGGFSLSIGIGSGGVAWFPLGPREVFVPWYRSSRGYVNNVNVTNTRVNVTQVTNVYNVYNTHTTNVTRITYVNQRGPAVTAVSHETFVNARPVARNFVRVDERQIVSAPVTARVDAQPVRASVMGAGAPARFRPPAAVVNRQVIGTRTPAPPQASFEQRHPAMNVRTETPGTPQPAARMPGEAPRATPGNPRMEEQGRPAPQPQVPRPEQGRAIPAQPAPRAEQAPQPEQPSRPEQPMQPARPDERSAPRPSQPMGNTGNIRGGMEPSRPQVRPAPPVQERPETQRSEEQKFSNWQQQRQNQRPAPQPQSRQPESRPQEQRAAPQQHEQQQRAPKPPPHDDNQRH
jgi:hypothetical protein